MSLLITNQLIKVVRIVDWEIARFYNKRNFHL